MKRGTLKERPRCTQITKLGGQCWQKAVEGSKPLRCKMHGGKISQSLRMACLVADALDVSAECVQAAAVAAVDGQRAYLHGCLDRSLDRIARAMKGEL